MARPNILMILSDQHRYDCLGCCGNEQVRTPHLDRLADDSVRFDRTFCTYPVCAPSRYSMLSGLFPHQNGCFHNASTLPPSIPSFPRILREHGYRTKAVGKMHFTPTYLDVGFDELELAEQAGQGRLDDDYHRDLRDHGLIDAIDVIDQTGGYGSRFSGTFGAETSNLPEPWHSTNWIGEKAVRTITDWSRSGNLLAVGFIKPHHPFDPPPTWDRMYDPQSITPLPGWLERRRPMDDDACYGVLEDRLDLDSIRRITAKYYATISQIDDQIGRMIRLLQQRGLYQDTLIIYTSDHGEYLGFHNMLRKGPFAYEPLVRVPLMIKFPGGQGAATVRESLVSLIDLAPTVLKQVGIEPPGVMAGQDLADPSADRSMIFAEVIVEGLMYMARSSRHKLMIRPGAGEDYFFDLEIDPLEMDNRIEDPACKTLVEQHRRALGDWVLCGASPRYYHVDCSAPLIRQPNVPKMLAEHRREMQVYIDERMKEYLSPSGRNL